SEVESFVMELLDMRYSRVQWLHTSSADPVEIYSELDDDGWEKRKIEIFRDGALGYASAAEATDSTSLGEAPVPSLEEIAAEPQFQPIEISKDEFERSGQGGFPRPRLPEREVTMTKLTMGSRSTVM